MIYPKISIVTPSFNDAKFLETTIKSVLSQGYPNLEYIIIDGGSSDGSLDIIKKYEAHLAFWISEKDSGMYHALQKGFAKSTGEVMGWINSDDILHTGSLFTLGQVFGEYKSIQWLQGIPNSVDEDNRIIYASPVYEVDKLFFYQRKHSKSRKYIQQESTFWRRDLWKKAGSYISTEYTYAGDFELWIRFFQFEKLHNIFALIGSFRVCTSGQLSVENYSKYVTETFDVLMKYPLTRKEVRQIKFLDISDRIERKLCSLKSKISRSLLSSNPTIINHSIYFNDKQQKFRMH